MTSSHVDEFLCFYIKMSNFFRSTNKNVSTSAVTRADKVVISELAVITEAEAPKKLGVCSNLSFVWQYYGALHHWKSVVSSSVPVLDLVDNDRFYCKY